MKQYVNEYDEALDALTNGMLDTSDIEPYMGAIVGALQKQIPIYAAGVRSVGWCKDFGICQLCGHDVNSYMQYCECCGQALKWK